MKLRLKILSGVFGHDLSLDSSPLVFTDLFDKLENTGIPQSHAHELTWRLAVGVGVSGMVSLRFRRFVLLLPPTAHFISATEGFDDVICSRSFSFDAWIREKFFVSEHSHLTYYIIGIDLLNLQGKRQGGKLICHSETSSSLGRFTGTGVRSECTRDSKSERIKSLKSAMLLNNIRR